MQLDYHKELSSAIYFSLVETSSLFQDWQIHPRAQQGAFFAVLVKMKSLFLVAFVALCTSGCAKEARLPDPNEEKADDSGTYSEGDVGYWLSYMEECPVTESDKYKQFYHSLKEKGIVIFPGVFKNGDRTTYHLASRDAIASFFQNRGVSNIHLADQEGGLGGMEGVNAQWDLFEKSMPLFSDHLKANPIDSGYALIAEYAGDEIIRVIHCYILDSYGEDAFSFLLNAHYKLFTDARLATEAAKSRDESIGRGADVIIKALQYQFDALSTE